MNKQEFNFKKIGHLERKKLQFAVDRSNYIDGWEDCIKELEKALRMKLDDILKIKKEN
jgi:hypothetical protein